MCIYDQTSNDDLILDAIVRGSRVLLAMAIRSLSAVDIDLTLVQYRSLVFIAQHSKCTVSELADNLGVSHPTVTRLCDRLIEKGLIERDQSSNDRRRVELVLRPKALEALSKVTEHRRSDIREILKQIPRTQWSEIANALDLISEAAGEQSEEMWYQLG